MMPDCTVTRVAGELVTIVTILVCSIVWILLSDGSLQSWLLGFPAVACSAWFYVHRAPANGGTVRLLALLSFVPWFLWESIKGGLEVSMLAFSRRGIRTSARFEFQCDLRGERAQVFFATCINLLPGTTAIGFCQERMLIHTLTSVDESRLAILDLQRRIADLFGLKVELSNDQPPRDADARSDLSARSSTHP
jgi:multicomponent Na+:H+ antiporter subunit E